jgi:hypothetical protein
MPGVYDRRMFRMANGGMIPPQGGMPPEMQQPQGGMPPEMQQLPPEMQQMAQEIDSMPPEMQRAEAAKFFEQAVKGSVEEAVNGEAGRSMSNVEGATGFRDLMNAVWDEEADVEAYRARLAEIVGPEDASRTPDSVLVLVQPTLQLAQLDQGIGALMQEELAEVGGDGAMGGGIAELATKSAVADAMASETSSLVDRVGTMSQGQGPMAQGPMPMAPGQGGPPMDPEMMQAMMQGAGPMGPGMV